MNKTQMVARLLSTTILCVAFALYIHHDHLHWNHVGRDAFMQYQAKRFDISMAHPHSALTVTISFLVILLPVAALYELLVLLIGKLLRIGKAPQQTN